MNNSLVWPNDHVKFRNISLTAHVLIMLETVKDLTGVSCRQQPGESVPILGTLTVSHECGTWCVTQREGHIFMVFLTKVPRKIFESRKGKVTED
jgi:hypothetical protein